MVTLNAYGKDVLTNADNLLMLVKLFNQKTLTTKEELERTGQDELAPDWFKGTSNTVTKEDDLTSP